VLCAELADSVELLLEMRSNDRPMQVTEDRLNRARAALAQPEPQGPTDEDLIEFFNENDWNYISPETFIDIARTVLEAWGRPAIEREPQGPTDEELWQIWHNVDGSIPTIFRAVLARWGRPAIKPVPVSDPPGPEDCDAEGRCWGWLNADDGWNLYPVGYLPWWAYWLPHWALPVPGVEGADD
jgi:hypothetical protein